MAERKKRQGIYAPNAGDLLSMKLAPGDEDIIAWLTAKQLRVGTISDFLRQLIRREIAREANGIPGDIDSLANKLAAKLQPYLKASALPEDDELGRQVKEALNEATEELLGDLLGDDMP